MAFPNLLKRLFDTAGAGVKLRGDIMPFSAEAPKAGGTASAGTSNTVARADHVHPGQTIGTASGTVSGTTKLSDATNSTSGADSGVAATPKAVKAAYDKAVEAKNAADAAFPKAGGTLTGAVVEKLNPLSGTSVSLDLKAANNFTHKVTSTTAFTVTANTGNSFQLGTLVLTNGGLHSVRWPSSFKWADGAPPSLMASGIDVITFFTIDGGTTYYAAQAMTGIA